MSITNLTATEIRRKFAEVIKKAQAGESFTVTRHGKVVMAVISGKEFEQLSQLNAAKVGATSVAAATVVTLAPDQYKVEPPKPVETPVVEGVPAVPETKGLFVG